MELDETRRNWEQFGRDDPLWAILTLPDRTNNRWKVEEFFQTGRQEIAEVMKRLSDLGIEVARDRCLDFGCGVGRLTQALCDHFERCDGVDIAASMVERANNFNRYGTRCIYHVNTASDLSLFSDTTFDFIYTKAVLQHMEPKYSLRYIGEFLRVLKPGGIAVFESPTSYTPLGPLPAGAHKAGIELVSDAPPAIKAGDSCRLEVRVTNLGGARWPLLGTPYPIRLANHWLAADRSAEVTHDDGRTDLPRLLEPGETAICDLEVTAPSRSGRYIIELDLVEEGVTWFADQGSRSLSIPVRVDGPGLKRTGAILRRRVIAQLKQRLGDPLRQRVSDQLKDRIARRRGSVGPSDTSGTDRQPVMEMHCVPRADVLAVVHNAGGVVLHTDESQGIGDGHEGTSYVVRRA